MKKGLLEFHIYIPTQFGLGLQRIKAMSFQDAFRRLGKKDRLKNGYIELPDTDESKSFNEILGLELT